MTTPLDAPTDRALLDRFRAGCGGAAGAGLEDLVRLADAFARLPYENLTKVLKLRAAGRPERARRGPHEVIDGHLCHGTGGTCFALTAALLHLVRASGWQAEPILADRHYGPDTHCAVMVWIAGVPHVIDPGFLVTRPLRLDGHDATLDNGFNRIVLRGAGAERVALHTVQGGHALQRLTYRTAPADPGHFLRAWDASFGWDMMHYPLLSRVSRDGQHYVQDHRVQVRDPDGRRVDHLDDAALADYIVGQFGLDRAVVHRALATWHAEGRRG